MAEEGEKKSSVRIIDKRRFDTEGQERDLADAGEDSTASFKQDVPRPAEKRPVESRAEEHLGEGGFSSRPSPAENFSALNEEESMAQDAESMGQEITFSSFVISLATQALMQLGQMSPPSGVQIPVDKTAAKQTIDILEMLAEKTKGNLDEEEGRLLEEILHNLRISFVRAPG